MLNQIFNNNPSLDCYFGAADGSCFFTENRAGAHDQPLENKKVKMISRSEVTETSVDPKGNTKKKIKKNYEHNSI